MIGMNKWLRRELEREEDNSWTISHSKEFTSQQQPRELWLETNDFNRKMVPFKIITSIVEWESELVIRLDMIFESSFATKGVHLEGKNDMKSPPLDPNSWSFSSIHVLMICESMESRNGEMREEQNLGTRLEGKGEVDCDCCSLTNHLIE